MKCDELIGMLDAFVDGELDDETRADILAHARACETCAQEIKRAETLKKLLSGLDNAVTVPLAAQAAWRNAVKAEARKKRMRGRYRVIGAFAAAFVVLIGVATGMKLFGRTSVDQADPETAHYTPDTQMFAFVASDGNEGLGEMQATPRTSEAAERTASVRITADDVDVAADEVTSMVGEFNGTVDASSINATTAYITAFVPADEFEAFQQALSYTGTIETTRVNGEGDDMISVTVTIQAE